MPVKAGADVVKLRETRHGHVRTALTFAHALAAEGIKHNGGFGQIDHAAIDRHDAAGAPQRRLNDHGGMLQQGGVEFGKHA